MAHLGLKLLVLDVGSILPGRGGSSNCLLVTMGALLGEYYRQRVVHFEQPPGEGVGAAAAGPASGGSSSIQGAGEGSVLGSMDGGGSGAIHSTISLTSSGILKSESKSGTLTAMKLKKRAGIFSIFNAGKVTL